MTAQGRRSARCGRGLNRVIPCLARGALGRRTRRWRCVRSPTTSSIAAPSSGLTPPRSLGRRALRERVRSRADHDCRARRRPYRALRRRAPQQPSAKPGAARQRASRSPVTATRSGSSSRRPPARCGAGGPRPGPCRMHVRDVQDREPVEGPWANCGIVDLAHAPSPRPAPPLRRPRCRLHRGTDPHCQRIIGRIVAPGTLQGRPQGRRQVLELRN